MACRCRTAQDALIDAVVSANPHTVVVLETGGPVTMPWLGKVPAVLQAFYLGASGGPAIAGVLSGRVNPSGRLPITIPADERHLPHVAQKDPATTTSVPEEARNHAVFHIDYNVEGADVGYRWFERQALTPLFPFGHGLSYTRFELSDVQVAVVGDAVTVSVTVANVGDRAGADVPQLYVAKSGSGGFGARLAGFARVMLQPGEERRVTIPADPRLLASFDAAARPIPHPWRGVRDQCRPPCRRPGPHRHAPPTADGPRVDRRPIFGPVAGAVSPGGEAAPFFHPSPTGATAGNCPARSTGRHSSDDVPSQSART